MAVSSKDLWQLVLGRPEVDPNDLAEAVEVQVARHDLDFRSRLLIRDSLEGLKGHWGEGRLQAWLRDCPQRQQIEEIWQEDLGEAGFPFLSRGQIMAATRPESITQFLRELGTHVHLPTKLIIGGAIALMMPGYLTCHTQDLDAVDEVPAEFQALGKVLDELMQRYHLQLTHFRAHYLPTGWERRIHSLPAFGSLQVYLVDVYDVLLSKLFSARPKDLDDLRLVAPQLDKDTLVRRLRDTAAALLAEERLRRHAAHNWYIVYGESLPS